MKQDQQERYKIPSDIFKEVDESKSKVARGRVMRENKECLAMSNKHFE
jgi:hypothetical protein